MPQGDPFADEEEEAKAQPSATFILPFKRRKKKSKVNKPKSSKSGHKKIKTKHKKRK